MVWSTVEYVQQVSIVLRRLERPLVCSPHAVVQIAVQHRTSFDCADQGRQNECNRHVR